MIFAQSEINFSCCQGTGHLAPLPTLALLGVFQARWASRFRVLCRKKVVGNFLGSQSGSSSLALNAFCICAFKVLSKAFGRQTKESHCGFSTLVELKKVARNRRQICFSDRDKLLGVIFADGKGKTWQVCFCFERIKKKKA